MSLFPNTELAYNVSAVFDQQFTEEKARGAAFHLGTKTLSRLEQSWTTSNKSSAPPLRGLTAGLGFLNFKKSLKQALRCWNKVHDIVNLWKCENLWKRSPTASQLRWRELAGLTSWGPSPPMWPLSSILSYPGSFLKRMRMKPISKAGLPSEARGTFKHRVWSRFGPRLHKSTSGIGTGLDLYWFHTRDQVALVLSSSSGGRRGSRGEDSGQCHQLLLGRSVSEFSFSQYICENHICQHVVGAVRSRMNQVAPIFYRLAFRFFSYRKFVVSALYSLLYHQCDRYYPRF